MALLLEYSLTDFTFVAKKHFQSPDGKINYNSKIVWSTEKIQ